MAEPVMPIEDPNRELPAPGPTIVELPERSRPRLNGTAEAIGSAVGTAVETVRHLPDRLQDMKARFTVVRGRAREQAAIRAEDWKQTARSRVYEARNRAQFYAREYPLHVIAATAGAAFILGFALRIWRSRA